MQRPRAPHKLSHANQSYVAVASQPALAGLGFATVHTVDLVSSPQKKNYKVARSREDAEAEQTKRRELETRCWTSR